MPSERAVRPSVIDPPPELFLVTAYERGDRRAHSYIVGLYGREDHAHAVKARHDHCRQGAYVCEVRGIHAERSPGIESLGRVMAELPERGRR